MIGPGFAGSFGVGHANHHAHARGVQVFVQPSSSVASSQRLALPEDPATPVILVGAGSVDGSALHAFLRQRKAARATGENWLLLDGASSGAGAGSITLDDLLDRHALLDCVRDGTLTRFDASFPPDAGAGGDVRARMMENARGLWAWIDLGASVYVCGEAARVIDVEATLTEVIADHGRMADDHAAAFVAEMARERRYQRYLN